MKDGKRLPRFRRDREAIAPMEITPRDLEIIRLVARHRFLRSNHITSLIGGSHVQINRRLKALFHHGFLERPRAQLEYYREGGSSPVVYGLGSRGAGLVRREFDVSFQKMDWSEKNQRVGRLFLEHALMVSDILVALEIACRTEKNVRLLTADDLPPVDTGFRLNTPHQWTVQNKSWKHNVIPDAIFGLQVTNTTDPSPARWFFVEADRGTMPVVRRRLDQSSILRKLRAYEATWSNDIHRTQMGLDRFRVLMVSSSFARANHILDAVRGLRRGHGLFLVTDIADFRTAASVLRHHWLSVTDEDATLLS